MKYDTENQNRLSSSNTPSEGVHLLPGSTHVAVGFADLGELAAAVSRWGPAADVIAGAAEGQFAAFPLEFDSQVQDWYAMFEAIMEQETQDVFTMVQKAVQAEEMGLDDDDGLLDGEADLAGAVGSNAAACKKVLKLLQQAHQLNRGVVTHAAAATTIAAGSNSADDHGLSFRSAVCAPAVGSPGQPLRWVGYDASAYAVAKAAVLVEMMTQGAKDDEVLQVSTS
jgi:hypothetical protein